MKNGRILLYRNNAGWMARFVDDPETIRLFGTDTIPTAFTKQAKKSEVVKAIQDLNPGCIIEAYGNEKLGDHNCQLRMQKYMDLEA
jgi:hypothetical protein